MCSGFDLINNGLGEDERWIIIIFDPHSSGFLAGLVPQHQMLCCVRPISTGLALIRPLTSFRRHMELDSRRPVENAIRIKLSNAFKPECLEVHNESHMHAVPPGSESHFRVLVVSSQFEGLPLIKCHRLVNEALKEELSSCVHALAIQAKTPEQWRRNATLAKSPPCMGGSKGDHTVEEKLKAGREWNPHTAMTCAEGWCADSCKYILYSYAFLAFGQHHHNNC